MSDRERVNNTTYDVGKISNLCSDHHPVSPVAYEALHD